MSENRPIPPTPKAREPREPGGITLRGTSVAPGLVLGPVHLKDYELEHAPRQRVPLEQVERELNRFHKALSTARKQIDDLKSRLHGRVPADHVRILDTHGAYLKDTVFLSDVENLIIHEQMSLEAAIAKVIADFDRIFRLVKSDALRERAVDLRDVGIRVLRNLEHESGEEAAAPAPPRDYVLVASELSIVDMFNLANEHVLGILTEQGGLTSHAAILARSMRIPTLTGVAGLLDHVNEGEFVILDATEGIVRIEPDEVVRAQYRQSASQREAAPVQEEAPAWARRAARTQDGQSIAVAATCGNLPEVDQAASLNMQGVGLYRTELLYLLEREPPSVEALSAHYAAVLEHAGGQPVTFRLLHADSSLEVPYLHETRELNPALGRAGVRALLAKGQILRRQLQAILRAPAPAEARVRIAVPFVTDCGDLRRVKEVLFEERYALRKAGAVFHEQVELGAIVETPAAAIGARDLAREADFLVVSLDGLQQYLLAADRENGTLKGLFESLHPFVLRALIQIVEVCEQIGRPLSVFGVTAVQPTSLPFLLGAGLRNFCVAPVALKDFLAHLGRIDLRQARRSATLAARATCPAETQTLVDGYRHGWARPQ